MSKVLKIFAIIIIVILVAVYINNICDDDDISKDVACVLVKATPQAYLLVNLLSSENFFFIKESEVFIPELHILYLEMHEKSPPIFSLIST